MSLFTILVALGLTAVIAVDASHKRRHLEMKNSLGRRVNLNHG